MMGYAWWQIAQMIFHAFLLLLLNPVLYLATILLVWDLLRNVRAERRFFGIRVTRVWIPLLMRYVKAVCVGTLLTLVCLACGIEVRQSEIYLVSGLSILLGVFRIRFGNTPSAIFLLIFMAWIAVHVSVPASSFLAKPVRFFSEVHIVSWLALLCVSYAAQFLMVWWHRKEGVAPALVESRRGRGIGALVVQLAFVIPVGVLTPGNHPFQELFFHWSWLAVHGGINLGAIPFVMGFSAVTLGTEPRRILKRLLIDSAVSTVVLAGSAYMAVHFGSVFSLAGVIFALLLQEGTILQFRFRESYRDAICAPQSEGVVVLYTIKGSLAEEMGLRPGEIITHVNQVPVHSEYDLHFAFDQNPAYAKLQVIDRRGELRIIGKPVYDGERHQLGLILAPQGTDVPCYCNRPVGLLQTLYLKFSTSAGGCTPYKNIQETIPGQIGE